MAESRETRVWSGQVFEVVEETECAIKVHSYEKIIYRNVDTGVPREENDRDNWTNWYFFDQRETWPPFAEDALRDHRGDKYSPPEWY